MSKIMYMVSGRVGNRMPVLVPVKASVHYATSILAMLHYNANYIEFVL